VKAWKGDTEGNLVYRKTARNHNPAIATAGRITIAEVEELVPAGSIDPEEVHPPGIYVNRVVQGERMGLIERLTLADKKFAFNPDENEADAKRARIVRRAALELQSGDYVNLGIGMPTLVSNHVPDGVEITLQSENGMLGVGPFPTKGNEDCDLINAGKQTVTALDGASFFSADQSFAMIRGAHCQVTILGSMQVAACGDMANYLIPGKLVKGMGGAMDLVASGSRVVVTMEHCDKKGNPKILPSCTLPLTGWRVVSKIITEKGVFEVLPQGNGLRLTEVAEGETIDNIRATTAADFKVADDCKPMAQSPKVL
jgi:3-oxoacid CoA-transferase